jgi:hypothetical protein
MAIVDSLSSPANNTNYDANADCHIITTWTVEDGKYNTRVRFRYSSDTSCVYIECRADGTNNLYLVYNDGSVNVVDTVTQVFTAEQSYQVDIYANGTNIKVDVDDVNKIDETVSYNETQTGGQIEHNLTTNDIELESWPHGEPSDAVEVTPTLGTATVTGNNPTVNAGAAWEIGAYIHTTVGGVEVNAEAGTLVVIGSNPVVTATASTSARGGFDVTKKTIVLLRR